MFTLDVKELTIVWTGFTYNIFLTFFTFEYVEAWHHVLQKDDNNIPNFHSTNEEILLIIF